MHKDNFSEIQPKFNNLFLNNLFFSFRPLESWSIYNWSQSSFILNTKRGSNSQVIILVESLINNTLIGEANIKSHIILFPYILKLFEVI